MVWIEIIGQRFANVTNESPPARVVWIEIALADTLNVSVDVATREGGVD